MVVVIVAEAAPSGGGEREGLHTVYHDSHHPEIGFFIFFFDVPSIHQHV